MQHTMRSRPKVLSIILVALVIAGLGCSAPTGEREPDPVDPMTIVFVHGAWGGGWQFSKVQPLLEAKGHEVYRPTMTGLGERVHLARPEISLSTHIEDIVKIFEFENLDEIILVGHSYGGMVITGVAERVPDRIARLVYLDAILPEDGESVEGLFGDAIQAMAAVGEGDSEPWLLYPQWVEPNEPPPADVPQPIRTFTEPIVVGNPDAEKLEGLYILTVEKGEDEDTFDVFAERARQRGFQVVDMAGGHNPHWFQPEGFVEVLVAALSE